MRKPFKKDLFITTYSGIKFHIFRPNVDEVNLQDCAHSLSMTCRFNSHTPKFYSVGSHSLIGAKLIANPFKKQFLCHDFGEAYVGDCVTPIKRQLKDFIKMEHKIERVINKKFRLPYPLAPEIKEMDNLMLRMEQVYLMGSKKNKGERFPLTKKEFIREISKSHKQVKRELIKMFKKLDAI